MTNLKYIVFSMAVISFSLNVFTLDAGSSRRAAKKSLLAAGGGGAGGGAGGAAGVSGGFTGVSGGGSGSFGGSAGVEGSSSLSTPAGTVTGPQGADVNVTPGTNSTNTQYSPTQPSSTSTNPSSSNNYNPQNQPNYGSYSSPSTSTYGSPSYGNYSNTGSSTYPQPYGNYSNANQSNYNNPSTNYPSGQSNTYNNSTSRYPQNSSFNSNRNLPANSQYQQTPSQYQNQGSSQLNNTQNNNTTNTNLSPTSEAKKAPGKAIAQATAPTKSNDSYTMLRKEPMKDPNAHEGAPTENLTVYEIAAKRSTVSTLARLLALADLVNTLEGSGPYTVFAPNDAAFAKLSPNTIDDLKRPENRAKLKEILSYHVVPGSLKEGSLKNGNLKTVNGKSLDVKVKGSEVTVNNAKVVKSGLVGKNGVVYIIDTVLIP